MNLFIDFKEYILENSIGFLEHYGRVPVFKCAIHSGEVIQSEIGKGIMHLAYHGDVLNTAARILGQCHRLNAEILISMSSVSLLTALKQLYDLEPINNVVLKGEQNTIDLFKAISTIKNNDLVKLAVST